MATETDGTVEVLKEIRDELRNVVEQMRSARAGVRTEIVDRAARWRMAAMASTGALAFVALVLAFRAGRQPTTVVMPAPLMAAAAPAPRVAPAPVVAPAAVVAAPIPAVAKSPAKLATAKPVSAKPASSLAAAAPAETPATAAPRKRAKPAAKAAAETADGDDDETMAFSPPPKRVRVHKMSYGPVESEPAKL